MTSTYNEVRESIDIMRNLLSPSRLVEDSSSDDGVPYGNEDEFYKTNIEGAKIQFGASFRDCEHPMLYYPSTGNVVFSGRIPTLNDAKFQFHFLDGDNGCYIWLEGVSLTVQVVSVLNKILGFFQNWKQKIEVGDVVPLSYRQQKA